MQVDSLTAFWSIGRRMEKRLFTCLFGVLLWVGASAQPTNSLPRTWEKQLQTEQRHFLRCLAFVYDPALWVSYSGSLFFVPKSGAQVDQLTAILEARARYVALTNRHTRYEITARAIADSGIDEKWQQKLLLPYSDTNQNITPTLDRPVRTLAKYEVVRQLPGSDAYLTDGDATYFVLDFGRAVDDAYHTNATLIKEGQKTYTTPAGDRKTVEAFTDIGLNREEVAIFQRVVASIQKQPDSLPQASPPRGAEPSNAALEFEMHKSRANDDSPFMEYLLAKDYLEGLGIEKNEQLGLEWMNRAAKSGSGDAQAYLQKQKPAER